MYLYDRGKKIMQPFVDGTNSMTTECKYSPIDLNDHRDM